MQILIAPSILAADFGRVAEEVRAVEAAGCDYIHVDVMDGQFVPNISIGQPVVAALKKATKIPLDVHLMIDEPERFVESFAEAGADLITVHLEACRHLSRTFDKIREFGKRVGVSLNPATPLEYLDGVLGEVDMILVMSVNPGFGGQKFITSSVEKIRKLKQRVDRLGLSIDIEVDGGVVVENAGQLVAAGANVLVSGTGIFGTADYADTICRMREAASELRD
ncbi:MAG: ribulose-phosphate 3-epimerase [Pseudomonadota bacterium]